MRPRTMRELWARDAPTPEISYGIRKFGIKEVELTCCIMSNVI